MPALSAFEGRILVVAFEGWNDAGEAASSAVRTLREQLEVAPLAVFDSEDLFDYQLVRPIIELSATGQRHISWPAISLYCPEVPKARAESLAADAQLEVSGQNTSNIYLLTGPEPTRNWRSLTADIVELLVAADIRAAVFLGALLADVPHTRPISVFTSSENVDVRSAMDIERSTYEGPTGILSVLAEACESAGITTVSLWASVPHYVQHSPSPKATLALIDRLEELVDVTIPRGELITDSSEWEKSINNLAAHDDEMAGYIAALEEARDETTGAPISGEALAREFENFLRERNSHNGEDNDPSSTL
jgi:hypothetical protein